MYNITHTFKLARKRKFSSNITIVVNTILKMVTKNLCFLVFNKSLKVLKI